jgi:tRNA threonylcarbamoyl adenosine modification protein YeaZ
MKILALEFSPPERSVAVIDGEVRSFVGEPNQGSAAFSSISRALDEAQLKPPDIECIAVGLGPGSYAGIRTAISIAQGWQLARGVKLLGVNSAEAIACRAQRAGLFGVVNLVFDAQRDEVYSIRYDIDPNNTRLLGDFELLTLAQEVLRVDAGEIFIKADNGPWQAGKHQSLFADAREVGLLAARSQNFRSGCQLEPIYLRKAEFVKAPPARFDTGS